MASLNKKVNKQIKRRLKKRDIQDRLHDAAKKLKTCPLCGHFSCKVSNKRVVCLYCKRNLLRYEGDGIVESYREHLETPIKKAPGKARRLQKWLSGKFK